MAISVRLLKLFVRLSTLADLAAWQKKKLETAKAESKPRELVHTRRCDPRFAHAWRNDPWRWPALDSGKRVRPSWDARCGFHRASTSGNVALGFGR
jgi:hypothetical protein